MTKNEILELLYLIKTEYPEILSDDEKEIEMKLSLWHIHLENFSKDEVYKAFKKMTSKNIYGTPKISDLMEILNNDGTEEVKAIIENAKDNLLNYGTESAWEYLKKYDLENYFGYWELRNMTLNRVDSVFKNVENSILKDKQHVQFLVEKREQYRIEYEKQQQLLESSK